MGGTVLPHVALAERLVALAQRLEQLGRPQEAAELYELVASFSGKRKELREKAKRLRQVECPGDPLREQKRANAEASHLVGMAKVHILRGELDKAAEMFDLAKLRTPFHYLPYAAKGYLYSRHAQPHEALMEFTQARKLNPLDFRLAVETARTAVEAERFPEALDHAIDAMLLSEWSSPQDAERARRRVETLARLCGKDRNELVKLIRRRGQLLQKAVDQVSLSRAKLFAGKRYTKKSTAQAQPSGPRGELIKRAAELRSMRIFNHCSDDHLIALARIAKPIQFEHAEVIFREGDESRDVYVVREAAIHIARRTPVGTQVLASCGFGTMFGELAYLDGKPRSASAYGVGSGKLFVFPKDDLTSVCKSDRDLAVALHWSFWHSLAEKLRAANAQMGEIASGPDFFHPHPRPDLAERVHIPEEEKIKLLEEQGLSAQELKLLATYSREERFPPEALIFAEGEQGDELFIVVDGAVRISRMVPGMGEETLAILKRGEMFGEMSLIDDQPRSADARAHVDGCTVFSVSRSLLKEVLAMDPDAAVQFLGVLCRLMAARLRAMNDRLVAWKVAASHE